MVRALGGFLARLGSHTRGNTFAIVAAALIPIMGMIGSGVDIGRAYMAKNRMQNACDAGSLAARRVMRNDQLTQSVIDTGKQFFNFNFPQGAYQTASFEPSVTRPSVGLVRITASTRIPTSIMHFFGIDSLPLDVDCDASLNFVNTEVVLVLDVTGSMLQPVPTADDDDTEIPKIQALREAVLALYDELAPIQAQLEAQGLRLRYGIVPYSSTVNVGRRIAAVDPDYIRNSTPYRTRVANYTTGPTYLANASTFDGSETQTYASNISAANCLKYGNNQTFNGSSGLPSSTSAGGPAPTATISYSYAPLDWGGSTSISGSGNKQCRRTRTATKTTYDPTPRYTFTNWTYQQASLNTSNFKTAGGSITLATNTAGSVVTSGSYNLQQLATSATGVGTTSYTWNGCIEERDTVAQEISLTPPAPENAFDLDINLIPNSEVTRWRPMLPEAIFAGSGSNAATSYWCAETNRNGNCIRNTNVLAEVPAADGYSACPSEARRLQVWTREALNNYVTSLQPVGGTYHDIGMIWGARFISTGGIFADGCETFNGMPCNRHVIFMTDGQQTAYCKVYSAYSLEGYDRRVLNANCNDNNLLTRHQQRFRMMCDATRNMTVSIWVIAFDTVLNDNLRRCADNDNQAKTSTNRDDLIRQFREIGNQIGALRLVE